MIQNGNQKNARKHVSIDNQEALSASDTIRIENYSTAPQQDFDLIKKESFENIVRLLYEIKKNSQKILYWHRRIVAEAIICYKLLMKLNIILIIYLLRVTHTMNKHYNNRTSPKIKLLLH